MKIRHFKHSILIGAGLIFAGLSLVLLRGLPTRDTSQSIAIIDWNRFGENLSEVEQPEMVRPLHQLNYNPNGRFYSTGLDPSCSLNEVGLSRDAGGAPVISGFTCLDTQGQAVSEDIILANSNVQQYMIVTFLGGTGGDDGGSVGVFDA